jgi:hypothetical protein
MHGAVQHRVHPHPESLQRFLLGLATEAERRAIVLHLLKGCPECLAVTRSAWLLAERQAGDLEDLEALEGLEAQRPRRSRASRRFSGGWRDES